MAQHEFIIGQTRTGYEGTPEYVGRHRAPEPAVQHQWMAGPGWWPARDSDVKSHRRTPRVRLRWW